MAESVVNEHGGSLPNSLDEMVKQPGVGRKTANVVLGNIQGIPSIVVDTHVTRITNLLKLISDFTAPRKNRFSFLVVRLNILEKLQ